MEYCFYCFGHENIRGTHRKTVEFTKDTELSPGGTCIIGINADFDFHNLKRLSGRIKTVLEVGNLVDSFTAIINSEFNDEREIVFRKSAYSSARTLAQYLDKAANGMNRDIIKSMRHRESRMKVTITELLSTD